MSLNEFLVLTGMVAIAAAVWEFLEDMWNAATARRRKAEEDARLAQVERIVNAAHRLRTPVVYEDRDDIIDVIPERISVRK